METKNSNGPLVSILIDNYNYAEYVGEAIRTSLDQTYTNIEVIVVDDGSKDNSREVISSFNDSRLKKVFKENGGQASAFNAGFELCSGEIVFTLDSDDYLLPHTVETVVAQYRPEVSGFHFRMRMEDGKHNVLGIFPQTNRPLGKGRCDQLLLKHGTFTSPPTSGKAFVRRHMAKFMPMPMDYRHGPDLYFFACVAFFGEMVAFEEPLAVWRQHGRGYHLNRDVKPDYAKARMMVDYIYMSQAAVYEVGRRNQVDIPDDLLYRSGFFMRYRVLEWKLRPASECNPHGETLGRLLRDCLKSVTVYAQPMFSSNIGLITWYLLFFLTPAAYLNSVLNAFARLKRMVMPQAV